MIEEDVIIPRERKMAERCRILRNHVRTQCNIAVIITTWIVGYGLFGCGFIITAAVDISSRNEFQLIYPSSTTLPLLFFAIVVLQSIPMIMYSYYLHMKSRGFLVWAVVGLITILLTVLLILALALLGVIQMNAEINEESMRASMKPNFLNSKEFWETFQMENHCCGLQSNSDWSRKIHAPISKGCCTSRLTYSTDENVHCENLHHLPYAQKEPCLPTILDKVSFHITKDLIVILLPLFALYHIPGILLATALLSDDIKLAFRNRHVNRRDLYD